MERIFNSTLRLIEYFIHTYTHARTHTHVRAHADTHTLQGNWLERDQKLLCTDTIVQVHY